MESYQLAASSNALQQDPALNAQVTELSKRIASVSSSVDLALYDFDAGIVAGSQLTEQAAKRLPTELASERTNQNSGQICEAGNGKDSGQHCQ